MYLTYSVQSLFLLLTYLKYLINCRNSGVTQGRLPVPRFTDVLPHYYRIYYLRIEI